MKCSTISIAVAGAIGSLALAQEVPELERLNGLYNKELERVTKPVQDGYRNALLRLQKKYTTATKLDDALAVREEIERLDAEIANGERPSFEDFTEETSKTPGSREDASELSEWKGDGRIVEDEAEEILTIKASTKERQVERSYSVEEFPDGMVLKFSYRSSDYTGTGMRLKGYNTPTGHYHRDLPIPNDGVWREYEWPYKAEQFMDARNIRMVIEVQGGGGNVEFKDVVVEEL